MKKSSDPRVATLAGAIGGGLEASFTWPTEFAKTQMQLQKVTASGEVLPAPGHPRVYKNAIDCGRSVIKRQGFFALYRGLSPILLMSFPKSGVRFGAFSIYSRWFRDDQGRMTAPKNFACGLMAGATEAVLVVTPQETLKVRLMNLNMGFVPGVKHIVAKEGIAGLYQGLPATIGKQATNQGIRFVTFNEYKKRILAYTGAKELSLGWAFLGGMFAGCCSVLGNNPVDCVKTRMQGTNASLYKNTLDCIMQTLKNEGPGAFYKGTFARLGRVVPGQAIVFSSYETITQMLEKIILEREAAEAGK